MESDKDALAKLIQTEAKKSGISSKDARKALKKLRSGGMMAQVAPQLQSAFMEMNPNISAKEKFRAKMKKLQGSRTRKHTKEQAYEKTRQEVHERQERELVEKEDKKKADAQRKRNHNKKINLLGKQIGTVTQESYNTCMIRLKENEYKNDGPRNRDKNIVELYGKQQEFSKHIEANDMDDI
jgi:hypothetical protein